MSFYLPYLHQECPLFCRAEEAIFIDTDFILKRCSLDRSRACIGHCSLTQGGFVVSLQHLNTPVIHSFSHVGTYFSNDLTGQYNQSHSTVGGSRFPVFYTTTSAMRMLLHCIIRYYRPKYNVALFGLVQLLFTLQSFARPPGFDNQNICAKIIQSNDKVVCGAVPW